MHQLGFDPWEWLRNDLFGHDEVFHLLCMSGHFGEEEPGLDLRFWTGFTDKRRRRPNIQLTPDSATRLEELFRTGCISDAGTNIGCETAFAFQTAFSKLSVYFCSKKRIAIDDKWKLSILTDVVRFATATLKRYQ